MNYRHAFHAGNHLDVFKHAALTLLIEHLRRKPAPFAVLDTHAGLGLYDLSSDEASRTGEAQGGVGRIFAQPLASAPAYSALLGELNPDGLRHYPGSPEIVRRLLRPDDRLVCCELHPADVEVLRARYRGEPGVFVHHRDGYEAIGALSPPPERRGLVLIDPPYEQTDEAKRLADALRLGLRKWSTGVFAAWYPIKDQRIGGVLAKAAAEGGFPGVLRAEFRPFPMDGVSLSGGGLLICNAPWKLDEGLRALCAELAPLLGEGSARWSVEAIM